MTQHREREEMGVEKSKEVEFYAAHIGSMLDSNIEKNRQLLTLSSLVIGVLMGFFDTDDLSGMTSFVMWMISCLSFTACTIITLIFFPKNAAYLKHVVEKDPALETQKKHLRLISLFASITFILGIVMLFTLVVYESKFLINKEQRIQIESEKNQIQ